MTFQDGADLVPTLFSIRSAWPTRLGSVSFVDAISVVGANFCKELLLRKGGLLIYRSGYNRKNVLLPN